MLRDPYSGAQQEHRLQDQATQKQRKEIKTQIKRAAVPRERTTGSA